MATKGTKTEKPLSFYETSNETTAQDTTKYDSGGIVFVREEGATSGKIYKDGVPFGGGGESETMPEDAENPGVSVGGLTPNTSVAGKTSIEVLEDIIYPEYAPYYVSPTLAITCKSGDVDVNIIQKVGNNLPGSANYNVTGESAKAIGNAIYTAENGNPTLTKTINSNTANSSGTSSSAYGTKSTKYGQFVVKASSVCADGTTTVKTNKGNETNKTGGTSSARTLLSSATKTSYTISKDGHYVVKGTTKNDVTHTINYVFAIYASTNQNGVLTEQTLTTETSVTYTLKKDTPKIAVPSSYTNVVIKERTGLGDLDNTKAWTRSSTTYKLGDNTTDRDYTVYTRNENFSADTVVILSFTVAN